MGSNPRRGAQLEDFIYRSISPPTTQICMLFSKQCAFGDSLSLLNACSINLEMSEIIGYETWIAKIVVIEFSVQIIRAASSEFVTYCLCEQRRFRRACTSTQSRQNLRCSLIQAVSQEEPSDRKPDPWPLWMARHAQLKFVMTECSKTQIRLTGPMK